MYAELTGHPVGWYWQALVDDHLVFVGCEGTSFQALVDKGEGCGPSASGSFPHPRLRSSYYIFSKIMLVPAIHMCHPSDRGSTPPSQLTPLAIGIGRDAIHFMAYYGSRSDGCSPMT